MFALVGGDPVRYVLAIATLVLSGVLLLLGIGQRTIFAGPAEIVLPVEAQADSAYAVIDGAELAKVNGQANVVVRGAGGFVSTGTSIDVDGWVSPYVHTKLGIDGSGDRILSTDVAAVLPETPTVKPSTAEAMESQTSESDASKSETAVKRYDPRGSDLWLEERSASDGGSGVEVQTLRVPVALAPDQSVLIASDGTKPIPSDVSLVWVQDRNTPLAGPFLVGGAVLAVLGGILYLLAIDHDRRGLGPRRGRRGPLQGLRNSFGGGSGQRGDAPEDNSGGTMQRSRRRVALPAIGLVALLTLSGCSAEYWPSAAPAKEQDETADVVTSNLAPVPVTEGQIDRILKNVAEVANASDDALNPEELGQRFTADALAQRTANYKIRAADPTYGSVPPRLTSEQLGYTLVQSTEAWPRTLLVTVASTSGAADTATTETPSPDPTQSAEGDAAQTEDTQASPSLALVLTQANPHENYQVSRVIALRGGITMPQAAPAADGTALLSNDIETLLLQPSDVGIAYAAMLQNGTDAPEAEFFDTTDDPLLATYGKVLAEQQQADSQAKEKPMRFSVTARKGDAKSVALSTGVDGALVATTVIEEQIVEADRFSPQATGVVTALSGLEGEQQRIVQEIAHQILFFVPGKESNEKIQVLGVTSEIVGVRN